MNNPSVMPFSSGNPGDPWPTITLNVTSDAQSSGRIRVDGTASGPGVTAADAKWVAWGVERRINDECNSLRSHLDSLAISGDQNPVRDLARKHGLVFRDLLSRPHVYAQTVQVDVRVSNTSQEGDQGQETRAAPVSIPAPGSTHPSDDVNVFRDRSRIIVRAKDETNADAVWMAEGVERRLNDLFGETGLDSESLAYSVGFSTIVDLTQRLGAELLCSLRSRECSYAEAEVTAVKSEEEGEGENPEVVGGEQGYKTLQELQGPLRSWC